MDKTYRSIPIIFLLLGSPLSAQEQPAQDTAPAKQFIGDDEKQALEARARGLRDQASAIRSQADADLATAEKECWNKFLVSACQDEARRRQRQEVDKARQLEHDAREIERDVRVRTVATREARRIEEEPKRRAAAAERAERNRQAQEEAQRRLAERQGEQAARGSGSK